MAASAGEDYELLFTADPEVSIPFPVYRIGSIVEGSGIEWASHASYQGFKHF